MAGEFLEQLNDNQFLKKGYAKWNYLIC